MAVFTAQWQDGISVKWRSLTWKEYQYSVSPGTTETFLGIYDKVSLDGPKSDIVPAGVAVYVAQQVLLNNPFSGDINQIKTALATARKQVSSYMNRARALVCSVLHYKLEDIDTWDSDTFFERLAMAEAMEVRLGRPSMDPIIKEPKKAKGTLWEQEMNQRPQRALAGEDKLQKRPMTNAQAETMRRAKEARRGR